MRAGDVMRRAAALGHSCRFLRPSPGSVSSPEVILLAAWWYLRRGLSYRDLEEFLAERGIDVDHVTVYRWVQRFTTELIDAARPRRHAVGDRWFVDESTVKANSTWVYRYRAWISTARLSTFSSHLTGISPRPGGSSPRR